MRVILLASVSGTRDGVEWPPRCSVVDLPADEATSMVLAGMAEPVAAPVVESATDPRPGMESATAPRPAKRGAKKV